MLTIPNLVIRKLYAESITEMLLPEGKALDLARRAAETLYQRGDLQPLCDFVEQKYFKVFSNRDYRWSNELTIKTAFLTLLFNDSLYIMESEVEIEFPGSLIISTRTQAQCEINLRGRKHPCVTDNRVPETAHRFGDRCPITDGEYA